MIKRLILFNLGPLNSKLAEALSNPEKFKRTAKQMMPHLTDQQLDEYLSKASSETSTIPIKSLQTKEYQRLLDQVNQPLELLMDQRRHYYEDHKLPYPRDYEPRTKVEEWDHIDVFECGYYLFTGQYVHFYEKKMKMYKDFLTSKLC